MDKIARIKAKIKKLKEKKKQKVGTPEIPGVSKPKKKQAKKEKIDAPQHKRPPKRIVVVGPRGGQYKETPSGKKDYGVKKSESVVKSYISELVQEEKIASFLKQFKGRGSNEG